MQANTSEELAQFESKKGSGGIFNRVLFWGLGAGLFAFTSLIAHWEPVVGDGWYFLDFVKKNSITWSSLFEFIARHYMNGNPRISRGLIGNGLIIARFAFYVLPLLGIVLISAEIYANSGGSAKGRPCPSESLYAVPEIEVVLWR